MTKPTPKDLLSARRIERFKLQLWLNDVIMYRDAKGEVVAIDTDDELACTAAERGEIVLITEGGKPVSYLMNRREHEIK